MKENDKIVYRILAETIMAGAIGIGTLGGILRHGQFLDYKESRSEANKAMELYSQGKIVEARNLADETLSVINAREHNRFLEGINFGDVYAVSQLRQDCQELVQGAEGVLFRAPAAQLKLDLARRGLTKENHYSKK